MGHGAREAMGARARAPARARVRACRVPCYGVMPASFEILPPETLSGATDAADARPPVFKEKRSLDDAHPGPPPGRAS